MHAAVAAELVLSQAGVESVDRDVVAAAQQLEALGRDDQMNEALLGADRTVADRCLREIDGRAEANPSTVTTAFDLRHVRILNHGGVRR